jgi:hypothetical protein
MDWGDEGDPPRGRRGRASGDASPASGDASAASGDASSAGARRAGSEGARRPGSEGARRAGAGRSRPAGVGGHPPRDWRAPGAPAPPRERPRPQSGEAAAAGPGAEEGDPLHGPESSPWVRYERLREEMSGGAGFPRPGLPDLSALLAAIEGLRALVPRELSQQVTALLRELLLTVRALIDWYLERLEARDREPEVEDIPID